MTQPCTFYNGKLTLQRESLLSLSKCTGYVLLALEALSGRSADKITRSGQAISVDKSAPHSARSQFRIDPRFASSLCQDLRICSARCIFDNGGNVMASRAERPYTRQREFSFANNRITLSLWLGVHTKLLHAYTPQQRQKRRGASPGSGWDNSLRLVAQSIRRRMAVKEINARRVLLDR